MKYINHDYNVTPNGIVFDNELDIDRLGWKHGDLFEITNINGQAMMRKIDPVRAFAKGYKLNFNGAK